MSAHSNSSRETWLHGWPRGNAEEVRQEKITCDKCGLSIEPPDSAFDHRQIAGGESLVMLARVGGGMGHNKVPLDGWHFHYLCFCTVVNAILSVLEPAQNGSRSQS